MSKLKEILLKAKKQNEVLLINDDKDTRTKSDYIQSAEPGLIVAFRLNFSSKQDVNLTKVISGKIISNDKGDEILVVETRNGLQYGVPYDLVVWVKTGERWPKGVYEEMKRGSVVVKGDASGEEVIELSELRDSDGDEPEDDHSNEQTE